MKSQSITTRAAEIWRNAFYLKKNLDSSTINKSLLAKQYKQHLRNQIYNPTITAIAMSDVLKKEPIVNKVDYFNNLQNLEKIPRINLLMKKSQEHYNRQYPYTGYIREILINNNRFSPLIDSVKPKMSFMQKLLIKFFAII